MKTLMMAAIFLGAVTLPTVQERALAPAAAELLDACGRRVGTATLAETAEGVRIHVRFWNLPPGPHAMHIHTLGKCHHGTDFKSSGGHFNPFGLKHGRLNPQGPHAGDLPNFEVKADGTAEVDVTAKLVTLREGRNSLFSPGGTCLMVHEKPDDEISDPTGNAGERIACGIIRKARGVRN